MGAPRTKALAGCLQGREYNVCTRQPVRLLMSQTGKPTDASQEHGYRWGAIERRGRKIAELGPSPPRRDPPGPV